MQNNNKERNIYRLTIVRENLNVDSEWEKNYYYYSSLNCMVQSKTCNVSQIIASLNAEGTHSAWRHAAVGDQITINTH